MKAAAAAKERVDGRLAADRKESQDSSARAKQLESTASERNQEAEAIEAAGLERYAAEEGDSVEACFQTLLTGLAVRYFKAVAG